MQFKPTLFKGQLCVCVCIYIYIYIYIHSEKLTSIWKKNSEGTTEMIKVWEIGNNKPEEWCHGKEMQVFLEGGRLWCIRPAALGSWRPGFGCTSTCELYDFRHLFFCFWFVTWNNNQSSIIRMPPRLNKPSRVKHLAQTWHIMMMDEWWAGSDLQRVKGGKDGSISSRVTQQRRPQNMRRAVHRER